MPSLYWPRFSLRTRIGLGVIAIVPASTLGIASTALYFVKRNMQESIANDQLARLSGIADAIDQKFLSRRTLLKTLAASVEALKLPRGNELQDFLLRHESPLRHSFDNVSLLDAQGNLVANLNGSQLIGKLNVQDREYFQRTVATMSGVISQPFRSRVNGFAQVTVTEPVVGDDGKVVYVLSGSINLAQQNFLGELANVKFGKTGYMFITNTDGIVIDSPRKSRILNHFEAEGGRNLATERAVAGFEGSTEAVNRLGVRGLYAFKQIRQTNWVLGSIYPRDEAFAKVDEVEQLAWAGAIFLTVIAGLLAFLTVHVRLVPLTRLHEHMQHSRGSAQYVPMQSMPPPGEIGDLARTFDALMRESHAFQERLKASEVYLRDILRHAGDAFVSIDRHSRITEWNEQAEKPSDGRVMRRLAVRCPSC